MILHIPHSGTDLYDYTFNNTQDQLNKMTDWFTDELYQCKNAQTLIFPFSRLVCDVERFEDDESEIMAEVGMGVCYEKTYDGKLLKEVSRYEKNYILNSLYRPHHKRLHEMVEEELKTKGESLIIDCHSFPNEAYYFNKDYGKPRVDICLGTDPYHTPEKLTFYMQDYFESKGFSVAINHPYEGTIVPLNHYHVENRTFSIMIEINRRLYLDNKFQKNEYFESLQACIKELLDRLSTYRIADFR